METSGWTIREAVEPDREAWAELYRAYAAGAGEELTQEHLDRVWSWIRDPLAQTRGLVLELAGHSGPVGLAHVRLFERPLAGSIGCYLDDLFVSPALRGRGGARAALDHLRAEAATNGWTTVRWTTGEANPATHLYDSLARRAPVISYDMEPAPRG